ncbi:oxidoreductase [Actinoplanes sp. NBRC 103695]|uniref:oxidoreductase n=1 Tax=Actinoplanes sp. NBRC 103695 TaxID=3032202 RepID=UPI00249FC5DC|nr:oxidoreductase [Actinoplanes sp. NBRC 103695]GLZ01300.1 short-chain dehydrogenase [Actinoplanes sp. NBRC 103695]
MSVAVPATGLTGKRVLVTGGTRGLGAAIAEHFVAAGSSVVVAARTPVPEPVGTFVAADLSTEGGARRLATAVLDILGGIDVLIDNAGSQRRVPEGVLAMTDGDWTSDISSNLLSAVRLDRKLLPTMMAQRSGVVVHIGSGAARLPQPAALAYAAAKAALSAYSKGLANAMAPHGIRVTTVNPGVIETTGLSNRLTQVAAESGIDVTEARRRQAELFRIPLGEFGTADDVAELVTFLASPRARYLTGTQFVVDGGFFPAV